MAEKVANLSGDDREKRVAELKRKMQEAAQKAQAAHAEEKSSVPEPVAVAPAVVEAAPAPVLVAEAPPVVEAVAESAPVVSTPAAPATNGVQAAPAPAPRPTPVARPAAVATEEETEAEGKGLNRREFLTYAWGAALALLGVEVGVASFMFMYPRFRAGEFGGDFFEDLGKFGNKDAAPNPEPSGKFWMVTTAEGKQKALYMVCVHLGCLYKWVPANFRFECPCHGSKYTHDGYYIEGPATRSLDTFEVTIDGTNVAVHTGKKVFGEPAEKSPFRAVQA